MITRTFKLCLNAGTGSAPFINVSQTDRDETWLFELYTETGERYIPSSGAIIGIKSDGHGIANTGTVDSEGRVVITETEQITAAAGRAIYELSIDGLTHGTANFIVNVEKKPIDGAIMSDSDLSLISQAIDSAAVIVDVIGDGDPSEVIGEHVDAWLDNHPEATTTVEDGAITAPKINSTLWDKLLVSESASGNPASFDDGADDVPVSSLKVNLEPIQLGSGDPSPSNIRPIIASNGKNLANVPNATTTQNAVTAVAVDGAVTANGTPSATGYIIIGTAHLTGGVEYTITGCPSGGGSGKYGLNIRDASGTSLATEYGSGATYTPTGDIDVNVCIRYWYNFALNNVEFKPMIRLASITDSSYQPYQGIMVEKCGKNLLNSAFCANRTNKGITTVLNADGSITLTGTADSSSRYWNASDTLALTLPSGTYTLTPSNMRIEKVGGGYSNGTFTLAEPTTYQNVYFTLTSGTTYNTTVYPQLEVGSEATEYEEYVAPTQYPYSLGQSVYGGTVDLATGVLTVTKRFVTSSNFVKETSYDVGNSSLFSVTGINDANINPNLNRGSISDKLKYDTAILNVERAGFYVGYGHIYARIAGISTLSDFNTAIGGNLSIAYTLATPQTIQLTPTQVKTLLGYNNISSSGTVDVIYHADTKLYVDKMTNVDNNIIAPTEADFVATRNYTVNDLVIVNDTLYKVTANIATGSAITPNSNVTQTTLGALIKALS